MNIKAILGLSALAVGGSIYLGRNKYNDYMTVLENLEFNMKSVRGVKLSGTNIVFIVDMELVNPTPIAVNIPGKSILVKTIHFYTPNNVYLGVSHPNVSEITMPANGTRLITGIPVTLSLTSIASSVSEIISIVSNPDLLKTKTDLVAFGQNFSVNS